MFEFENNDSAALAHHLVEGTYHVDGRNADWYLVHAEPGKLSLHLTPDGSQDIRMVVYDDQMHVLGSNYQTGVMDLNPVTAYSNGSSDFYIQVFDAVHPTTGLTHYTLDVDTPDNSWAKTFNFGPIRDASISFYDIDNDGKDEIFIGTSKALDSAGNEIRPAGLIVLEDDGTVKWTQTFPGMSTPDPYTGKMYQTTSVTTAPAFSDLDGDGKIDIVVGVGGDSSAQFPVVGQPGDKGGVYALGGDGHIMWFHQSLDIIGGPNNAGDGRPDGVHGSPVVFDINRDGVPDVIYNGWDQHTWILDGRNGNVEQSVNLLDTIWSTPKVADLNGDNIFEILVSADISANPDARTTTGGIFHVLEPDGTQSLAGWNTPIGNPNYTTLRGKWEEQTLWSSPVTGDLDGDGKLEIAYGTGNYFADGRGQYIDVWHADGTKAFKLSTNGRTYATPLIADINGDGHPDIVATTLNGYVQAWNYDGTPLFSTNTRPFGGGANEPIFASPIAVDLNNDGKMELLFGQGAQLIVVDSQGHQISNPNVPENIFQSFIGSPAAKDLNHDGRLEIVSGGTTANHDQAVVYKWNNPLDVQSSEFPDGRYQFNQSQSNIQNFVERFYEDVLGRHSDPEGLNHWVDYLSNGTKAGSDVARGFIFSQEYMNMNVSNNVFVQDLYSAFFDREPDSDGYNHWIAQLAAGGSRYDVLNGFILSQEFANLCGKFSIKPTP